MPKVIHFEIPAENPERAVEFYRKVFDWRIEKWKGAVPYWIINAGEDNEVGINGAIHEKGNFKTVVNIISVSSIDEFLNRIIEAGGKIVMPKGEVPGGGYIAYAEDTEGNPFGIFQGNLSIN
ncbi:MAG TPA: VOC family protein [Candidatus Sulfotelmatobacter sp.]|nr:VOC family protein [Candidatus Sulfotelmatobacter sp.]